MDTPALHAALKRALSKVDNNQSRFASAIGTSQQLVSYWINKERPLPAEYVLPAERAGLGSRHDLRPDLYPTEAAPAEARAA
ncbi:MAG: Cro/Cl family transcriptional regulator [Alphaproteobacteria bacterium]|nr:MAG: Cro/Cl family transcriptional regulator [Alphaproteobacteria bacterium]